MPPLPFNAENLLDAQEGVVYATLMDGRIVAVGRRNWTTFVTQNMPERTLRPDTLIGTNLFDHVHGESVQKFYRERMEKLAAGNASSVSFGFRCDSPETARHMRMNISLIRDDRGHGAGFLFQSLLLSAEMRPPIDIFDAATISAAFAGDGRPILTLCSVCQRVRDTDAGETSWIPPEAYYRSGGGGNVRVSHGVCPDCIDTGAFSD